MAASSARSNEAVLALRVDFQYFQSNSDAPRATMDAWPEGNDVSVSFVTRRIISVSTMKGRGRYQMSLVKVPVIIPTINKTASSTPNNFVFGLPKATIKTTTGIHTPSLP